MTLRPSAYDREEKAAVVNVVLAEATSEEQAVEEVEDY